MINREIPALQGRIAIIQSRKRLDNVEKQKTHFLLFASE